MRFVQYTLNSVKSATSRMNYRNVIDVVKIPEIEELNIGHSIISRALFVGLDKAIREMLDLLR